MSNIRKTTIRRVRPTAIYVHVIVLFLLYVFCLNCLLSPVYSVNTNKNAHIVDLSVRCLTAYTGGYRCTEIMLIILVDCFFMHVSDIFFHCWPTRNTSRKSVKNYALSATRQCSASS